MLLKTREDRYVYAYTISSKENNKLDFVFSHHMPNLKEMYLNQYIGSTIFINYHLKKKIIFKFKFYVELLDTYKFFKKTQFNFRHISLTLRLNFKLLNILKKINVN